jgi:uncharacterized repeat protein (TIGR04076 family)
MKLIVTVEGIEGVCPVYKEGDRIILDEGYRINMDETNAICMHSLSSLMPYYVALSRGISPKELGLAKEGDEAYVQCLDPCEYTGGGTVTFRITIDR